MKIYDISRIHQEAPLYPGTPTPTIELLCDLHAGADFTASLITSASHVGTHADAFCHFVVSSDVTIDNMDLSYYYGECRVVTVPSKTMITKEDLVGKVEGIEKIVLRSGGESFLLPEAAKYLVECGIKTVVTDSWSVAPLDNEVEIHNIILGAKVAIVESVTLDEVADGEYILSAFPIKYGGGDGAPVRAVLIQY